MLPVAATFLSPTSLLATDRIVAMLFVGLLGVIPLSLKPTINSLQSFAIFSVFLFALVVLAIVVICSQGIAGGSGAHPLNLGQLNLSSFGGVSIIIFAFANTSAILPIYIEMENSTQRRFMTAQIISTCLTGMFYILAGSLCYTRFGTMIQGNLLNNFPLSSVTVLMRLAFGFALVIVYPFTIFPCRLAVEHLILGIKRQFTSLEFSFVTFLIVGGSFGVAVATTNVDLIFGLTGAIAFSLSCFVFPAVAFLKSVGCGRMNSTEKLSKMGSYWFSSAVLLAFFGMLALVLGVIAWAQSL
jgi:amino acid permease